MQAPSCKEAHFFDNEAHDWLAPNYELLHDLYPPPDGRMRFEATPISIYWPEAIPRIAAYNSAAKIIVILRDPVERAFSHWRMTRHRGEESLTFSAAIREGRERMNGRPHRLYSYVERGFYAEQLQRLAMHFPQSQVLQLSSERMRFHQQETLVRVGEFLGIQPPASLPVSFEGQSGDMLTADRDYLEALYS